MSSVRKFKVKTKLARVALAGGGITAFEAMKRADAAVDLLREPSLELVDEYLAEIERRFGRSNRLRDNEPLEDVYTLSSRIIDASIGLPNAGIELAGRALCDLIDISLDKDVCDWEAIDLHVETLRLLRTNGQAFSQAQRDSILDGLKKVTLKRVGDPNTPAPA